MKTVEGLVMNTLTHPVGYNNVEVKSKTGLTFVTTVTLQIAQQTFIKATVWLHHGLPSVVSPIVVNLYMVELESKALSTFDGTGA